MMAVEVGGGKGERGINPLSRLVTKTKTKKRLHTAKLE